jgi:cytochrome c553
VALHLSDVQERAAFQANLKGSAAPTQSGWQFVHENSRSHLPWRAFRHETNKGSLDMPSRISPASLFLLTAIALVLPALTRADGDAEHGRKLAYTCYGCHGIPNYKNVYPTYSVPKLEGQHAEYLVTALQAYRGGERAHGTMHSQAATMSDQDMQDIAAFIAGKALASGAKPVGSEPEKVKELCVACHGPDGVGITPLYPSLAGQHEDYLERALLDYRDGGRKNPVMGGFVAQLTDKEIREVAEYYSKQRPSLSTAEHAAWFAQEKHESDKK